MEPPERWRTQGWQANKPPGDSDVNNFFRALALLVAVCCLTWLGVLWWWQRADHDIGVTDVLVYLGVLPLALLLLLLALRWAWRSAQARQAAATAGGAGAAASAADASVTPQAGADAQAGHGWLQLVGASVCSVAGEARDLLDAAAQGKPLPKPDAELTDDEGMPVLSARISELDHMAQTLQPRFDATLASVQARHGEHAGAEPDADVWRALAALTQPLQAQWDELLSLMPVPEAPVDEGVIVRPQAASPLPVVQVLLCWPAHWGLLEQRLARQWVEQLLWSQPDDRPTTCMASVIGLPGDVQSLWLRVDQMAQAREGDEQPDWMLLAACHSDLAASRIDALAHAGVLFDSGRNPGGRIPGEGAAALLLTRSTWQPPEAREVPVVRMHRAVLVRREKSVEARGRVAHSELAQALELCLQAARIEAGAIAALVCGADQHSPRGTELFGLTIAALGHLDPVEDMCLLGRVTGHLGVAGPLLALAAAREQTLALGGSTLALGMDDPVLRLAVLVQPAPAERA